MKKLIFTLTVAFATFNVFSQAPIVEKTQPLSKNASVFANTIYHFTPEFGAALEYQRLQTTPLINSVRKNDHFNLTFVYSF